MTRVVIGLCGPEGAGKSTAAKLLAECGAEIVPFAKPLKDMLRAIGVPEHNLTGTTAQKLEPVDALGGRSARHAMQTLGTEWGRNQIAPDFWSLAWRTAAAPHNFVVADDVRFKSEIDSVEAAGGLTICIVRKWTDFRRVPQHASEDFAALNFNYVVVNDGTPRDLALSLLKVLRQHFNGEKNRQKPVAAGQKEVWPPYGAPEFSAAL